MSSIKEKRKDCKKKKEVYDTKLKECRKRKQKIPISKTFKTYGKGQERRFKIEYKKGKYTVTERDFYTDLSKNYLCMLQRLAKTLNIKYTGKKKSELIKSIAPYIHFE